MIDVKTRPSQRSPRNLNNLKGIELLRGTMLRRQLHDTDSQTRFCIPPSSYTRVTRVNSSRARASSNFNPSRVSPVFSRLRFHIDKAGQLTTRPSTISFVAPVIVVGNITFLLAVPNRNKKDRFLRRKRVE